MGFVIIYLLAFLGALGVLWSIELRGLLPEFLEPLRVAYNCVLAGGLGGCIYCLRGVYLSRSVRDDWDNRWFTWYLLRPVVSALMGGVAYIFLRGGLLVLDAEPDSDSISMGFIAVAFIAGLNVDRFLVRIEEVAQSAWGVRPSRASEGDSSSSPHGDA